MTKHHRTNMRLTAPKLVRQIARSAKLTLDDLANAIIEGQPDPPTSPEAEAIVRDLVEAEREVDPLIDDDALAANVQVQVSEMVCTGDPVVAALRQQLVDESSPITPASRSR